MRFVRVKVLVLQYSVLEPFHRLIHAANRRNMFTRPQTLEMVKTYELTMRLFRAEVSLYDEVVGAKLLRPPGARLRRFAELCFSQKTYSGVFEPLTAEMYHEWFEALNRKDYTQARFVVGRYRVNLVSHFVMQIPISLGGIAKSLFFG